MPNPVEMLDILTFAYGSLKITSTWKTYINNFFSDVEMFAQKW